MATTNITIRMDDQLKKQFAYFCEEIGLSVGTAITVFAKKVVRENRIPFEMSAHREPNKETIAAMLEAEQLSRDPNAKRYNSLAELFEELDSE